MKKKLICKLNEKNNCLNDKRTQLTLPIVFQKGWRNIISWVDDVNWPFVNRSDEGLTHETSAFKIFTVANLR